MGQALSRRVMPHLTRATEKHEQAMMKDALDDIALRKAKQAASQNKYIDPSAVGPGGFRRDQWTDEELSPQDYQQKEFLRLSSLNASANANVGSGAGEENENPHEMPEDLIKFLNDAGPLERRVDKNFTSPRVYDALKEEEEREDLRKDMQRRRRVMPMIENDGAEFQLGSEEYQKNGTTVSRTTNFSVTPAKRDEKSEIRLENGELFDLLSRLQSGKLSAETFVKDHFKTHDDDDNDDAMENSFVKKRNSEYIDLIKNITAFNEIPTLMQDTDGSLVGAWSDQVDALKMLNVRMAPNHVKLCLEPDNISAASVGDSDEGDGRMMREQPMTTAEFLRRAKSGEM